ncbi:ATP-dependent DNA helicase PIF1 [Tetrabaena socialis]|uniref:ATP-dependent DNA helicase n=1 Tax=Tetrabaena socialis TaxID=47790 RepID=A0A2J8AJ89_9CHLO|nr:ATP-dependent DNA helicase PIF1 [Tetrabaena socialis]|eukprot:PNH12573.1 ATP-dependent DNA helicase PIF1 [Tetrabaena socialis]
MAAMALDPAQQLVVDKVMRGESVFFTGSAGTGKTFLLNTILNMLKEKWGASFGDHVAVAAMTGIAATHIEGTTLNAAIGIGAPSRYRDFKTMHRPDVRARIKGWDVLVIDECSMMSAEMFEIIEHMFRVIRRSQRPAGGLQLILCGDFFQLPPVCKVSMADAPPPMDVYSNYGYAFQAPAWQRVFTIENRVILTQIFRQSDATFAGMLNCIRVGEGSRQVTARLVSECGRAISCAEGIKPTQIFARNADVDRINMAELVALPGQSVLCASIDEVIFTTEADAATRKRDFFKDCIAAQQLSLKEGAQVMLLKNLDPAGGLVNGSRGVVTGFQHKSVALARAKEFMTVTQFAEATTAASKWWGQNVPVVRFVSGREFGILPAIFRQEVSGLAECKRIQMPLKLAWTITIHKSQGLTLDAAQVSLTGMFAPGQAYVALSRARSKEGLEIVGWDNRVIPANKVVVAFYQDDSDPIIKEGWSTFCKWRWGGSDDITAAEMMMMSVESTSQKEIPTTGIAMMFGSKSSQESKQSTVMNTLGQAQA